MIESFESSKAQPPLKDGVTDVTQLRERIDSIDDELIQLLLKRIELSTLVMKLKPPSQTVDPTREQAIINRYFGKLSEASTLTKTKRLVLGIIGAAKIYPDS